MDKSVPARWVKTFKNVIALYGGVRATGRILGISPSTASRLGRGEDPDPGTARHIGAKVGVCPCCGGDWPSQAGGQ